MLCLATGGAAVAATDYVFTTNDDSRYGERLKITEPKGDPPCVPYESGASTDMDWPGYLGRSWGIARDRDYSPTTSASIVWTSIRKDVFRNTDQWGGTSYIVSAELFGRDLFGTLEGALPVDIAGKYMSTTFYPRIMLIPEKQNDRWHLRKINPTASSTSTGAVEPSQVEWVGDGHLFLGTDAQASGSCGSSDGEVRLFHKNVGDNALFTEADYHDTDGTVDFKPEGLTVIDVSSSTDTDCASYDYVAYVADYCGDALTVLGIVENGANSTLTHIEDVSIASYVTPGFTERVCHPSTVEYLVGEDKAVILCQTSETYIIFDTVGFECSLSDITPDPFQRTRHKELLFTADEPSGNLGTCANPFDTDESCYEDADEACSPHDVAYDEDMFPDWFFVTMSGVGQINAIAVGSSEEQSVIFHDSSDYEPMELELAKDPS